MGVYLSCYDIVTELNIFLGKNNGKRKFYLKTKKSAKKYGKPGRPTPKTIEWKPTGSHRGSMRWSMMALFSYLTLKWDCLKFRSLTLWKSLSFSQNAHFVSQLKNGETKWGILNFYGLMLIIIDFSLKDFKRFVKSVVLDHLASLEILGFLEKANSKPSFVTKKASLDDLIASISKYWT